MLQLITLGWLLWHTLSIKKTIQSESPYFKSGIYQLKGSPLGGYSISPSLSDPNRKTKQGEVSANGALKISWCMLLHMLTYCGWWRNPVPTVNHWISGEKPSTNCRIFENPFTVCWHIEFQRVFPPFFRENLLQICDFLRSFINHGTMKSE